MNPASDEHKRRAAERWYARQVVAYTCVGIVMFNVIWWATIVACAVWFPDTTTTPTGLIFGASLTTGSLLVGFMLLHKDDTLRRAFSDPEDDS